MSHGTCCKVVVCFSICILLFVNLTVLLARGAKHLGSSQRFQSGSHSKLTIRGFHGQVTKKCLKSSRLMADGVTNVPWDDGEGFSKRNPSRIAKIKISSTQYF